MDSIFVVHLVAAAGLLIGLGFFVSVALSVRKTMRQMERTLHALTGEMLGLVPRISSVLQQMERTGEDIGRTAVSSGALIDRLNGRVSSSPLLDGATRFFPAAVALLRLVGPIVGRRFRSGRTDP